MFVGIKIKMSGIKHLRDIIGKMRGWVKVGPEMLTVIMKVN